MAGYYPYKFIHYLGNAKWKELVFMFLGTYPRKAYSISHKYVYIYINPGKITGGL